jgi:hypothetical protein
MQCLHLLVTQVSPSAELPLMLAVDVTIQLLCVCLRLPPPNYCVSFVTNCKISKTRNYGNENQSPVQLAKHNRVQLIWVLGYEGIGNEMADQLARTGFEYPFIGPAPACGISVGVAKKAVRDWTNRNRKRHWECVTELKQAKELKQGPSARRTKDLLKLNRYQLRGVVGLFIGHYHLKGHFSS